MTDPKLTEAQINDLRMVASPDCEWREVKEVVARMIATAEQTARAEERQRLADDIAGSFPLNGELRHDGSVDPLVAAYVEGLHDAWAIVRSTP